MKPIKIIRTKLLKAVDKLRIGETAWIKYEAMWVDFNKDLYIDLYASTSSKKINATEKSEGYLLQIKRVEEGAIAYYKYKHHRWEYDYIKEFSIYCPEDSLMVVASSDEQYEMRKRKPSIQDLEDQIDQRAFDLLKIEDQLLGDERDNEKNFKKLALQARNYQKEIDLLVAKREEMLEKKKRFRKQ